jgi:hypothetical protein
MSNKHFTKKDVTANLNAEITSHIIYLITSGVLNTIGKINEYPELNYRLSNMTLRLMDQKAKLKQESKFVE